VRGKVYLVGAGPGSAELLTIKAFRLLKSADVVLHDDLIGPDILDLIPKSAQRHGVGKRCGRESVSQEEINSLLTQYALLGLQVVRLKGGDPLIFGRGGEEIDALRHAGIEIEIVPGVTAALGAAADACIPLTHRRIASSLLILTGHRASSENACDWPEHISNKATVVVYMPGYHYEDTARRLQAVGLDGSTPCAVISQATSVKEQVFCTTLDALPGVPRLPAPTLLVVGEVVRFADPARLHQEFDWIAGQAGEVVVSSTEFAESGTQEQSE
jgi:uroporphyrin-III C-methyltransferase